MNYHSIRCLKAIGVVFLIVTLLSGLSSCVPVQSQAPGTSGINPSETGNAMPSASAEESTRPSAPPAGPFTDGQIKDVYAANGLSILEIRDAAQYTMVHYNNPKAKRLSRFDWFDRVTGDRELVCGWVNADRFEISADKSLTVLMTGVLQETEHHYFPKVITSRYTEIDGAVNYHSTEQDYYMPLEQSFTVGVDRHEYLKSVCFDGSAMLLTFAERPGYETEFHVDVEMIPKISVTNQDGISTVRIYKTILSDGFVQTAGWMLGSEPSPVTVTCDGMDTVITFRMHTGVERYNISSFNTPVDCVPHAVITYASSAFGYPKGW